MQSVRTISNAMDVGNPSNFIRIQHIHDNNFEILKNQLSSYSFSDDETRAAMLKIFKINNYVTDPHGAVGYLGLKKYLSGHPKMQGIFLETAHPVKFLDVVEPVINRSIEFPPQIKEVMYKTKEAHFIHNYEEMRTFLLNN
jgi:threonine synthase